MAKITGKATVIINSKKDIDKTIEEIKSKNTKKLSTRKGKFLIPTGCDLLDLVVQGGYSIGTMVNIVGDKSSGKSYLACELIATARALLGDKLKWFYDDAEAGFSFDTESMYGFNVLPEDEYASETVEDFSNNLNNKLKDLKKDEMFMYVLDSLDALSSEAEKKRDIERQKAAAVGKTLDTGTYGMNKAKFLSEFFRLRKLEIKNKNCLLIIISQVRERISIMPGPRYTRIGGKAMDFYANICLWLTEIEKLKKKSRPIGICIKAETKKAKISKPFRSCYLELLFDYGIDNISSNIKYLYDLKTEKGKNRTLKVKWDGKEYSPSALIKYIDENDLEEELKKRVVAMWNEIEDSIATKRKKSRWETKIDDIRRD